MHRSRIAFTLAKPERGKVTATIGVHRQQGFTLIELSIVLVILGLLVGGVVVGQSLIHAAQLKSITSEYLAYKNAVTNFRDKYQALPGDMSDAYSIWGDDCGTNTADPDTGCNGNGNGVIEYEGDNGTLGENLKVWKHLAKAGLIRGNYTGVSDPSYFFNATNIPKSKLPNSYWDMTNSFRSDSGFNNCGISGICLIFGSANIDTGGANTLSPSPSLSRGDGYHIDLKMDDGDPIHGLVQATSNDVCGTASYWGITTRGENEKGACTLRFNNL